MLLLCSPNFQNQKSSENSRTPHSPKNKQIKTSLFLPFNHQNFLTTKVQRTLGLHLLNYRSQLTTVSSHRLQRTRPGVRVANPHLSLLLQDHSPTIFPRPFFAFYLAGLHHLRGFLLSRTTPAIHQWSPVIWPHFNVPLFLTHSLASLPSLHSLVPHHRRFKAPIFKSPRPFGVSPYLPNTKLRWTRSAPLKPGLPLGPQRSPAPGLPRPGKHGSPTVPARELPRAGASPPNRRGPTEARPSAPSGRVPAAGAEGGAQAGASPSDPARSQRAERRAPAYPRPDRPLGALQPLRDPWELPDVRRAPSLCSEPPNRTRRNAQSSGERPRPRREPARVLNYIIITKSKPNLI